MSIIGSNAMKGVVGLALGAAIAIGCSSTSTGSTSTTTTTTTTTSTGSTASAWNGLGDGIWRRNAVYAETVTFDPCNAHQPGNGEYHYHDNPVCLRYQVGDNITGTNVGTTTATFKESTGTLVHSPILGWAFDGYPVYGPYGYSSCGTGAASSGIRRITPSYGLRTDNTTTRTTLPAWAAAYQGISATLTSTEVGPPVSTTYPLGRYIEDYDYFAGSGDLDAYNGRFCPTPDFPNGTYAYYVTISASGAPAFPYYLGPQFYGTVAGGNVTSVTETTTSYFANHAVQGNTSLVPQIASWLFKNSSQYAEVISQSNPSAGALTTWSGNTSPVYADVQGVSYSTDYVYVKVPGLASHVMGPWYLDAGKTQQFPNYPTNQNATSRIPLTAAAASSKVATAGGAQGRWINGVAMYNMLDFHSWSYSAQADQ
jgi:hypothetical protein